MVLATSLYSVRSSSQQLNELAKDETDPLLITSLVKPGQIEPGQNGVLEIHANLPEKFHAYSDQIRAQITSPEGFKISQPRIENEIEFYDKFSKKQRQGFTKKAVITFQIEAPLDLKGTYKELKFDFTYQACADTFCLFPITKTYAATVNIGHGTVTSLSDLSVRELISEKGFETALRDNLFFAFLLVFFAGLLTSFTPCIFPMIPITLSVIGQNTLGRTRRQSFFLSLSYVHGIALTYALLGVFAALSGGLFGQWIGNKYVLVFMCGLFFLMALSMYGYFEVQLPLRLQNKLHGHGRHGKVGYIPAFFTGMISGLVASPCVGPILVSILAFVASTKNVVLGFFLLFTYAMGLGLIFMMIGLFSQITKLLPRSGPWMDSVKFVLGTLMLMAFYYYLSLLIPSFWWNLLVGVGLVVMATILGAFRRISIQKKFLFVRRSFAWFLLALGLALFTHEALQISRPPHSEKIEKDSRWEEYSESRLAEAKKNQQPVIIDFYADWCLACHELDERTFSTDRFKELTAPFKLLRFDATKESAELEKLKKIYRIQGLPTVVFINGQGEILHSITLTQFEKVEAFEKRIKQVK